MNLDAAVSATLELESYLPHRSSMQVASTASEGPGGVMGVAAVSTTEILTGLVECLVKRVECLKSRDRQSPRDPKTRRGGQRKQCGDLECF